MIYFKTLSVVEFLIVGLFVVVKVDMLKYLDFGISLQLARIYLRLWRLIAFIKDLVLCPMYCLPSISIMIIRLNRAAYLMFKINSLLDILLLLLLLFGLKSCLIWLL